MSSSWGNSRGASGKSHPVMDQIMETDNNQRVDNLANKISMLKGIAIDIDRESKQQNRYIDEMGDDFGSTTGLLGGSVQRLTNMISSGKSNRTLMCYIIIALVIVFLILYYGLGRIVR